MINKYQFLSSGGSQTTIASIFIAGDFASLFSSTTSNNIIDVQLSWANFDATSGKITSFYPYDGSGYYARRLSDNNYGFVTGGAPIITGYTIIQAKILSIRSLFWNYFIP